MRCKKARILLSALLDGELTRSEELALERHMSACAVCAREKAQLSALRDSMTLWADGEPSAWLAENFAHKLRRLAEEGAAARPAAIRARRRTFGTAAAGFAAVLVAIGLLLHSQIWQPAVRDVAQHPALTGPSAPPHGAPTEAAKPSGAPAPIKVMPVEQRPAPAPAVQSAPVHVGARPTKRPHARPVHRPAEFVSPPAVPTPEEERLVVERIATAGAAQRAAVVKVTDNLGEAGLAMNESIERVRGTLRKAADLLVSEFPMPAEDSTDANGGNAL